MANDVQTSTQSRPGGVSRLALLISFIAGAFAAWIVITVNLELQETPAEEASAPVTMSSQPSPKKAPAPKPAPKTGAPKSGT